MDRVPQLGRLHPIRPYFTHFTHFELPPMETAILSKFRRGSFPNQVLCAAIFTSSLAESRRLLLETIWSEHMTDELVMLALASNNDADYLRKIAGDGTLAAHPRFNTLERIADLMRDENGPPVMDAMTKAPDELRMSHRNMMAVPQTQEEKMMALLENTQQPMEEQQPEEEEEDAPTADERPWKRDIPAAGSYTWLRTVWYRVNMARTLLGLHKQWFGAANVHHAPLKLKVDLFINAHLRAVQYLDSLVDPCDANVADDLDSLYVGLGPSHYSDDAALIRSIRGPVHQICPTPIEVLKKHWPQLEWTVERIVEQQTHDTAIDLEWTPLPDASPITHRIYYACIHLLNRCRVFMEEDDCPIPVRDALRAYYAGFVELFTHCLGGPKRMDDAYLLTPMGSSSRRGGGMNMSEAATPWELYGVDAHLRAFHAGDLPDLFHVLHSIPLWGEQCTPNYAIGRIYQKSLPFACQRRHLIKLLVNTIENDEAAWKIISRLFWVMLANLYPGELGDGPMPTFRELLRAHEITSSKQLLLSALKESASAGKGDGIQGGPLVVFVAFRLHILYMASHNPSYVDQARKCIDWDHFWESTIDLANMIRETSLFPDDPFAQARKQLGKTIKNPNAKVHRFKGRSQTVAITAHMNATLEKIIIQDKHARATKLATLQTIALEENLTSRLAQFQAAFAGIAHDAPLTLDNVNEVLQRYIAVNQSALPFYESLLNIRCKGAILNMLIRMPPEERMTLGSFSLLTLPECGGISQKSAENMARLTHIYYNSALPRDFKACIDELSLGDFVVACFYFNMVTLLANVHFVTLDADTVERTDRAMLDRHGVFPGQTPSPDMYNIVVALCCRKVCSFMGQGKYGAKDVSYNLEKQHYTCARGKMEKIPTDDGSDSENSDDDDDGAIVDMSNQVLAAQEERVTFNFSDYHHDLIGDAMKQKGRGTARAALMKERKAVRNERKHFNRVPCTQPLLTMSLRGRALIWGTVNTKKTQIMFCPQCGALHIYTILNFSGSPTGLYRCNECARKELAHIEYRKCAYCHREGPSSMLREHYWVTIMDVRETDPAKATQTLYFCSSHYVTARMHAHNMSKQDLWVLLEKRDLARLMDAAMKY